MLILLQQEIPTGGAIPSVTYEINEVGGTIHEAEDAMPGWPEAKGMDSRYCI